MNTRLKIDLNQGTLEVEGAEAFVKAIYDEFKSGILAKAAKEGTDPRNRPPKLPHPPLVKGEKGASKQRRKAASYSIIKDLDLSAKKNKQSLRDFFKLKLPSSNMEKNIVFIYYLQKIASVGGITPNHVYSCYKDVNIKIPQALEQSLIDTAHHKGWIDTSDMGDLKVAIPGENFVEHDLPKKKE